jgi:hypothetical protein
LRKTPPLFSFLVGWHGLLIALMMEAATTSETLVQLYQTTRCYNPGDSHLPFFDIGLEQENKNERPRVGAEEQKRLPAVVWL